MNEEILKKIEKIQSGLSACEDELVRIGKLLAEAKEIMKPKPTEIK